MSCVRFAGSGVLRVSFPQRMRVDTLGLRVSMASAATLLLCILCFGSLAFSADADGDERILSFDSDITVHEDSSMTVRETITVNSSGVKIRRGIYRDFPTRYKDLSGNRYTVDFRVMDVMRNGNPEPFHEEGMSNGTRVYIGEKNTLLRPGIYTYTLVYRTDRQLGFFSDHDELYWNVNGNGWEFPIDRVSATVTLPKQAAVNVISTDGYTGFQGDKGSDYEVSTDESRRLHFVSTRPFRETEGLTIVVAWPKGYVREPDTREKAGYFLRDYRGEILALAGLMIILAYYLFVWTLAGRDPQPGIIVTRYTPPDNMTPAVMRYVTRMGYDDRTLAAAVIDMAAKGHLTISEDDGEFTLSKKAGGERPLSPEEEKLMKNLLGSGKIVLKAAHHQKIRSAIKAFRDYLALKYERVYFVTNRKHFFAGLGLTIIALIISGVWEAASRGRLPIFFFICIWLSVWTAGVLALVNQVAVKWRHAIRSRGMNVLEAGGALFMTIFSLPFIAGEVAGISLFGYATSLGTVLFLLLAGFTNYLFYHLLKAPTRAGRSILDSIEGFRTFLAATEEDRMDMLNPPERTPELFERYLPYALALNLEHRWAEQFADVLAAAKIARDGTYSPAWFSGTSLSGLTAGDFTSAFGAAFSGAISSSSAAPGSGSGGGGGGSSGGGGGGGGGGGW